MRRGMIAGGVALAAIYVLANCLVAGHFWFWWDELTVLQSQSDPLHGLLQNHEGNWFPLGRLAFLGEVTIFRNTYGPYIAVNALLVVAIVSLVMLQLTNAHRVRSGRVNTALVFPFLLLVIYATSSGVLYDVQWGFQICWFLSVFFVVLGAYLVGARKWPTWWFLIFVALSFLSLSSNLIPMTIAGIALLRLQKPAPTRSEVGARFELVSAALAVILTGVGYAIGLANPPGDLRATSPSPQLHLMLEQSGDVVARVVSAGTAWLIKPIGITMPSSREAFGEFGTWLDLHMFWCAALVAVIGVVLVVRSRDELRTSGSFTGQIYVLLAAVYAFEAIVTVRGWGIWNVFLASRYDASILLIAAIFWATAAGQQTRSRILVMCTGVIRALVVITAVVSIVAFPSLVRTASDANRIAETPAVRTFLSDCQPSTPLPPFLSVQSSARDDVCSLYLKVGS